MSGNRNSELVRSRPEPQIPFLVKIQTIDVESLDFRSSVAKNKHVTFVEGTSRFIFVGCTSGSVYVFSRENLQFLLIIPFKGGKVCSIASTEDESDVAVGSLRGQVSVYRLLKSRNVAIANSKSGPLPVSVKHLYAVTHHNKNEITEMHWSPNGRYLFIGDNQGLISQVDVGSLDEFPRPPPSRVILQVQSRVLQLDCIFPFLAINTLAGVFLCDIENEDFTRIHSANKRSILATGICLSLTAEQSEDFPPVSLYIAPQNSSTLLRYGTQGNLLQTLDFQNNYVCPGEVPLFDPKKGVSLNLSTDDSDCRISFGKLYSSDEGYLISASHHRIIFLDPVTSKVICWNDDFRRISTVKVVSNYLFLWEANRLHVVAISSFQTYGMQLITTGLTAVLENWVMHCLNAIGWTKQFQDTWENTRNSIVSTSTATTTPALSTTEVIAAEADPCEVAIVTKDNIEEPDEAVEGIANEASNTSTEGFSGNIKYNDVEGATVSSNEDATTGVARVDGEVTTEINDQTTEVTLESVEAIDGTLVTVENTTKDSLNDSTKSNTNAIRKNQEVTSPLNTCTAKVASNHSSKTELKDFTQDHIPEFLQDSLKKLFEEDDDDEPIPPKIELPPNPILLAINAFISTLEAQHGSPSAKTLNKSLRVMYEQVQIQLPHNLENADEDSVIFKQSLFQSKMTLESLIQSSFSFLRQDTLQKVQSELISDTVISNKVNELTKTILFKLICNDQEPSQKFQSNSLLIVNYGKQNSVKRWLTDYKISNSQIQRDTTLAEMVLLIVPLMSNPALILILEELLLHTGNKLFTWMVLLINAAERKIFPFGSKLQEFLSAKFRGNAINEVISIVYEDLLKPPDDQRAINFIHHFASLLQFKSASKNSKSKILSSLITNFPLKNSGDKEIRSVTRNLLSFNPMLLEMYMEGCLTDGNSQNLCSCGLPDFFGLPGLFMIPRTQRLIEETILEILLTRKSNKKDLPAGMRGPDIAFKFAMRRLLLDKYFELLEISADDSFDERVKCEIILRSGDCHLLQKHFQFSVMRLQIFKELYENIFSEWNDNSEHNCLGCGGLLTKLPNFRIISWDCIGLWILGEETLLQNERLTGIVRENEYLNRPGKFSLAFYRFLSHSGQESFDEDSVGFETARRLNARMDNRSSANFEVNPSQVLGIYLVLVLVHNSGSLNTLPRPWKLGGLFVKITVDLTSHRLQVPTLVLICILLKKYIPH
ncbi:unnamed protein product [Allacma fusca]|uniref:Hermansky-Pudlak syndrome 5 protein homolog n=1 Tax=Allacma fusca TaxID=39272 RepID=A0A8J2NJM5_9HEXA|nr:unnamed protein product [Allacma fusca]